MIQEKTSCDRLVVKKTDKSTEKNYSNQIKLTIVFIVIERDFL